MNIPSLSEQSGQELNDEVVIFESQAMRKIFEAKKRTLNLNQSKLAALYGVKPPSIHDYLHGKTSLNPKFASFFAEQLQVGVDEFSPRIAKEIKKTAGFVVADSFNYPVLTYDQIDDRANVIHQFQEGSFIAQSFPSKIPTKNDQGFWLKLDSNDMESINGGISFSENTLVLVDPDLKPNTNEYAIFRIKYDKPTNLINSDSIYLFRLVKRNGVNLEAHALNTNISPISLDNDSMMLVGKVVAAIYPSNVFSP